MTSTPPSHTRPTTIGSPGPTRFLRARYSKSPPLTQVPASYLKARAPRRASAYDNTYTMYEKKAENQQLMIARALRETLDLESKVASSRVVEVERLLQSVRDEAQVAQVRVAEMDEDIGHMLEYFRTGGKLAPADDVPISQPEAVNPVEMTSSEAGDSNLAAHASHGSLSVRSQGDEQSTREEALSDDEELPVPGNTTAPLTTLALKQLNEESVNLGLQLR